MPFIKKYKSIKGNFPIRSVRSEMLKKEKLLNALAKLITAVAMLISAIAALINALK